MLKTMLKFRNCKIIYLDPNSETKRPEKSFNNRVFGSDMSIFITIDISWISTEIYKRWDPSSLISSKPVRYLHFLIKKKVNTFLILLQGHQTKVWKFSFALLSKKTKNIEESCLDSYSFSFSKYIWALSPFSGGSLDKLKILSQQEPLLWIEKVKLIFLKMIKSLFYLEIFLILLNSWVSRKEIF